MSKKLRDNVSRAKAPSPVGKSIFIGLRVADVFWQYSMIRSGLGIQWIQKIGGTPISTSHVLRPSMIGQIHPYYALVSLMALGSSVKQILAIAIVSEQETSVSSAITIALFNTIFNSTNTLLSLWAVTSMLPAAESTYDGIFSSSSVAFAAGAYLLGILVEAISEFQRTAFKRNPENRGKPYGGGLFSLATNINYGGYTIWRAAYALASGGWTWAALTFSFFLYDFATRGVPVLDEYLVQRYGDDYKAIKSRVKYSLIPGIY